MNKKIYNKLRKKNKEADIAIFVLSCHMGNPMHAKKIERKEVGFR